MPRPYWSGHIQISLVSFGVKLFVATEAKGEIRFHQISRSTGERVRHQKVLASALEESPDEAAAPVEKDEIVKGYEYTKGQYVLIEPSEIANLRVPSKHTVDIQQFVSLDELPPEYLEKPYFVVPENDIQAEAFAVVRAALAKSKKAGLGKIAFGGREHILALTAAPGDEAGMMAYTMRYQEELRKPAEYFHDIKKVKIDRTPSNSPSPSSRSAPPSSTPPNSPTATRPHSRNSSKPSSSTSPSRTTRSSPRRAARSSTSWTPCARASPTPRHAPRLRQEKALQVRHRPPLPRARGEERPHPRQLLRQSTTRSPPSLQSASPPSATLRRVPRPDAQRQCGIVRGSERPSNPLATGVCHSEIVILSDAKDLLFASAKLE